jgi:hypothetical protein
MARSGTGLNWRSHAPKPADVSLEAAFGDSSAVVGWRVDYCPILMFFLGLLCKSLIINAIYLHKSFRMDSQCPTECARITARLANWAKRKGEIHGDIAIQAFCEGAFFERSWPEIVGAVF